MKQPPARRNNDRTIDRLWIALTLLILIAFLINGFRFQIAALISGL